MYFLGGVHPPPPARQPLRRSWRVRWSAANKFHELCASLGGDVTNEPLCGAYEGLLQDSEAEVRDRQTREGGERERDNFDTAHNGTRVKMRPAMMGAIAAHFFTLKYGKFNELEGQLAVISSEVCRWLMCTLMTFRGAKCRGKRLRSTVMMLKDHDDGGDDGDGDDVSQG